LTAAEPQHPDAEQLRAFASGSIGDRDLARVAEHLDGCAACRDRVDGLLTGDGFLEKLQSAGPLDGTVVEDEADRRRSARALLREVRNVPHAERGPAPIGPAAPREVGEYTILHEVGRGGMGVVYQARHRGLRRLVALKMILAGGFASESQRQRFRREAELAARVQHPNIVQIYEVGVHDGHPFLAMEWVGGGTLAERIGGDPWPPGEAARLVETLARAIDVAHRQGVVHRDLKPSNILIQADPDGEPTRLMAGAVPKVGDFGLARATDGEGGLTASGLAMGTPEYMAPEQAAGAVVGPAADIYALGVMLYQLLAGQPPFRGTTPFEVLRALTYAEPVAPRRFRPHLPRDLETITLKAIEKDPARRYATAGAMADDLGRFLSNQPIRARPPTVAYRLVKWAARRPGLAALASLLVAVTVLALVGITALWVDAAAARDRARASEAEARRREAAERRALYRAVIAAASSALELNHAETARAQLEAAPAELRNWEWRHFAGQLDTARAVIRDDNLVGRTLAISPDGRRIASGSEQGAVGLWDARTESLVASARGHDKPVMVVVFGPDGRTFASAGSDGIVGLWDGQTAAPLHVLRGHESVVLALAFSPDGRRLATTSEDRTVRLWEVVTGRCLATLRGHADIVTAVAFSPDGRRLASAGRDPVARVWDVETHALVATLRGHAAGVHTVVYRPDGKVIATGGDFPDSTIRLWDAVGGAPLAASPGHENEVDSLAFSPDGRRLASASQDQTVRLWDGSDGRPIAVLRGHSGLVIQLHFSPDGRRVLSLSHDQSLRMWDAAGGEPIAVLRGHAGSVLSAAFSPDGRSIASTSPDRTIRLWDVPRLERNGVFRGHTSYVYDVAFTPDGTELASAGWDHTVRFWEVATGRQTRELRHDSTTGGQATPLKFDGALVVALALRGDAKQLATTTRDNRVYLWDVAAGRPSQVIEVPTDDWAVHPRAAIDPAGRLLATGGTDGRVRLWDAATGERVAEMAGHEGCASDVAFSPDGSVLASGGADGTVRLWDPGRHSPVAVLKGHSGAIHRLAYSADGRLLASASQDQTVRLWDGPTRRERAVLAHGSPIYGVAFSPDGTRLATGCADNTIRLWDVATAAEVAELRGHRAYVHAVAFSPDGTRLASCSGDFTVRIWDSLSPQQRDPAPAGSGR
jgi:eukaryotic-like serine/threonine-protein kinase